MGQYIDGFDFRIRRAVHMVSSVPHAVKMAVLMSSSGVRSVFADLDGYGVWELGLLAASHLFGYTVEIVYGDSGSGNRLEEEDGSGVIMKYFEPNCQDNFLPGVSHIFKYFAGSRRTLSSLGMTFMTLPQRIELEQGKKAPSEIKELTLSHSKSTVIEGLSDEFTNLEVLNLVGVGLEDLSGLPKLPSLKILDLSNNAISGGLEALLNCPNLETLNLSANKVATIDTLLPLAKLSCLSSIDLFNCEVTGLENYRKTVFAALPNLKYLDGLDENNEEEPTGAVPNGDVEEVGFWSNNHLFIFLILAANGEEKADDDEEKDSDDDEEEEEEYGIEALQRSGDLEDDDEDYAPGHFGQSPLWARELCLNILVPDHEPLHRVIWCPPKANQELTRLTDTGMEFGPKSMLRRAHFNPNRAAMHAHFSFHSQMGFFFTLICVLHLASSSVVGHEQLALWCPSLTTTFKQQLCFVDLGEEEDAELGEYDDDDDEDDDEEEEDDEDIEDDGANLSGAGVTGPRRPGSKRRRSDLAPVADDDLDDEAPVIKHKASEETEGHINNGATLE
ncbi:hypothetical protein T265_10787 [Opisthorchis viverrini]|uniref:U2A'/phosphoprotein 32 family A C-terminal domain-containing protein n=1 Tax=Opisthorchis viverrini TaxID=6198 RepID=A0A075A008_OPIVI|nr:hypothetical protein T265_10787 [Opisthorchis viverrini]KER20734.1 hypothetical protein T265_10787 [Opisthorchis viverrini]